MTTIEKNKYATDPELRKQLTQLRSELNETNKKFGSRFNVGHTFISKYCNDKLDHNPANFESLAWDILRGIKQRMSFEKELFETSVTRQMHGRINFIRETSDIGILHGKAGIGKSSAALLWLERHPSSLYIELNARTRNGRQLESQVMKSVDKRDWAGNSSRFDYLVSRLAGSQRVILVDNAQRLDGDGRSWIFDFHDATECPIVLIGNPEVLDKINGNDQLSSRIGISKEIGIDQKEITEVATRVAAQFSNQDKANEISDLITIIAKRDGHLRSVRKEVILMDTISKLQPQFDGNPRQALRAAHKELVRDYDLPQ